MRKSIMLLAFACLGISANAQKQFVFTDEIRLRCPEVADQGNSGTCWCFSTMSFMESEMMFFGNSNPPDLSEMFVVRQNYIDRALKHVMLHGKMNFGEGSYFWDNFIVAMEHGLVPQSVFPNTRPGQLDVCHSELSKRAEFMADSVAEREFVNPVWTMEYEKMVNGYLGECPDEFEYHGRMYTPRTFADSVVRLPFADYVQVTSFSHHEFYKPCILEIPDNWRWSQFLNVRIDDLAAIVDAALESGHTVLWASDVSEDGFNTDAGYALMPGIPQSADKKQIAEFRNLPYKSQSLRARTLKGPGVEVAVTQESRQDDFMNRKTTDDHGMHIVGRAHDQNGNKFYIVKNSWGRTGKYKGYFYVSENYLKAKTTGLLVHKSALGVLPKAE